MPSLAQTVDDLRLMTENYRRSTDVGYGQTQCPDQSLLKINVRRLHQKLGGVGKVGKCHVWIVLAHSGCLILLIGYHLGIDNGGVEKQSLEEIIDGIIVHIPKRYSQANPSQIQRVVHFCLELILDIADIGEDRNDGKGDEKKRDGKRERVTKTPTDTAKTGSPVRYSVIAHQLALS